MTADDWWRLLSLQDTNTRIALLGTSLLGLGAGAVGSLAVLRRRALMGDALAHAALPGVWIAFVLLGDRSFVGLMLGAAAAGTLGVLCVTFIREQTRIKEDAAIGIVLSVFFAAGLCLSRIVQTAGLGNTAGLDTFIFGKAASLLWEDVRAIATVTTVLLVAVALLYKEFRLICFDREFAGVLGWPVRRLDILLMGLVVACTVIGLPAVGAVLVAALLIIPAAAARFWTERLWLMIVLAALFGMTSGAVGCAVSALQDLATGPAVVLAAAIIFTGSLLAAPRRGLLPEVLRRAALRRKVGLQNLLRAAFEVAERGRGEAIPVAALADARAWTGGQVDRLLRRAGRAGFVERRSGGFRLTTAGRDAALRVVRAHRLWEAFLIEHASIAPDHVDRDADQIEHVLPPALLADLEAKLRGSNRWPTGDRVPASSHVIGGGGS